MIIHSDSNDLLQWRSEEISGKTLKLSELISEASQNNIDQPLKVEISKEGMEAYKKMYQECDPEYPADGLNIHLTPEGMVFGNKDWPDINDFIDLGKGPEYMLSRGLTSKWYDDWTSVKDKASSLISAYAKAYDEIVQGYESGIRVKYRINNDYYDVPKKGVPMYRCVTMEEELAALKESFEARADNLEEMNKMSCSTRRNTAEMYMDWAERGFLISRKEAKTVYNRYLRLKMDESIVDVRQKLIDAASVFVSQYKESGLSKLNLTVL